MVRFGMRWDGFFRRVDTVKLKAWIFELINTGAIFESMSQNTRISHLSCCCQRALEVRFGGKKREPDWKDKNSQSIPDYGKYVDPYVFRLSFFFCKKKSDQIKIF